MAKKRKKPVASPPVLISMDPWLRLGELITAFSEAAVAESWKGGGDPADVETLELRLKLASLELGTHIAKMQRDLE